MDVRSPVVGAPLAATPALNACEPEFDIDLDRIVYDPAYRRLVRDQLNRAAGADSQGA